MSEVIPNRERIEKFVTALRSDRFKQCSGKLAHSSDGETVDANCCLGVACEVMIELGGDIKRSIRKTLDTFVVSYGGNAGTRCNSAANESTATLTLAAHEFYGIEGFGNIFFEGDTRYEGVGIPLSAISMNDAGHSFAEIADKLEEKFLCGVTA